jgi:hypothetical protein
MALVIDSLGQASSGPELLALARACLASASVAELTTQLTQGFIGALARSGQAEQALRHTALMLEPRSRIGALTEIGAALVDQGGSASALRVIEDVRQLLQALPEADPDFEARVRAWSARCLAQIGRREAALEAAQAALAGLRAGLSGDARAQVLQDTARAHLLAGQRSQALRLARQLTPLQDPALLVEVGDEERLAKLFDEARRAAVAPDEAVLFLADSLHRAGRTAEAELLASALSKAIARWPDADGRVLLQSSAAVSFAQLGRRELADTLATSAMSAAHKLGRRLPVYSSFEMLRNLATLSTVLGRKARAAQQARRALALALGMRAPERLDCVGVVAELLCEAGRTDEARALLDRSIASTWALPSPWAQRDAAGALGEALVRVGRLDEGLGMLEGLSDRYGDRGRAQVRLVSALAAAGAFERAAALAQSTDELYRSDALGSVARAMAGAGLGERAWALGSAIEHAPQRAWALCRIAHLNNSAELDQAREQARRAGHAEALGLLAERLAAHGAQAEGLQTAQQALAVAQGLEGHAQVAAWGELARASLALHDKAGLAALDQALREVQDGEYRSEGRLRLALALAQAGRAKAARAIVDEELPAVEGLIGRDVPRATMLATLSLILWHAGATREAGRRARIALVQLRLTGAGWNSDYDKDLAWQRALAVLEKTGRLEAACAAGEIGPAELAAACASGQAGGELRLRSLLEQVRALPPDGAKSHALAAVAQAWHKLGRDAEARVLVFEALRAAYHAGRSAVFDAIVTPAPVIAAFDGGQTLAALGAALKQVDGWWPENKATR